MNPITLSDAAVAHIKSMLVKDMGSVGFRLAIKKTGCSGFAYVPNIIHTVQATDIHFMAQDNLAVYLDAEALPYLDNVLIDYVIDEGQGLKQKRLVFVNPKETGRCGCGESFTIE